MRQTGKVVGESPTIKNSIEISNEDPAPYRSRETNVRCGESTGGFTD